MALTFISIREGTELVVIVVRYDLLDLFAFRVLVVRSGRLSNLHNLLGQ